MLAPSKSPAIAGRGYSYVKKYPQAEILSFPKTTKKTGFNPALSCVLGMFFSEAYIHLVNQFSESMECILENRTLNKGKQECDDKRSEERRVGKECRSQWKK